MPRPTPDSGPGARRIPRPPAVAAAVRALAEGGDDVARGAVYTRRSVVDAILDLVGYRADADLVSRRVLEPSFGGGDFLFPLVERLLHAYARDGGGPEAARAALAPCLRAVEIHAETFASTRAGLVARLGAWGLSAEDAEALAAAWLRSDDFLLTELDGPFDAVVGNPPYVRPERLPAPLRAAYRSRYRTLYARADLYVAFYERSLDLLGEDGVLGFICANRWVKNRYGGPLREKVAGGFELRAYIDLDGVDAFQDPVAAYPAITVIRRRAAGAAPAATRVARQPDPAPASMARLTSALGGAGPAADPRVSELRGVTQGRDPWLLDAPEQLRLIRRLEEAFPDLGGAGCAVGIGVATGADRVFIGDLEALPVEAERKLPLVMASDLVGGRIDWGGRGVVNPFTADGGLAPLDAWPGFAAYLEAHRAVVAGRYVAKRNPARWYRTIDPIHPGLRSRPKLLIPDIQGAATVVLDPGDYYPHHNLYYVVSDTWDLRALQAVLRSSVAVLFVAAYGVRMAGGYLRFQAQYLRRIRAPRWADVPAMLRAALIAAADHPDPAVVDAPVFDLFGLDAAERARVSALAAAARVGPAARGKPLEPVPTGAVRPAGPLGRRGAVAGGG